MRLRFGGFSNSRKEKIYVPLPRRFFKSSDPPGVSMTYELSPEKRRVKEILAME